MVTDDIAKPHPGLPRPAATSPSDAELLAILLQRSATGRAVALAGTLLDRFGGRQKGLDTLPTPVAIPATLTRLLHPRQGDEWKENKFFPPHALPVVAEALNLAFAWISEERSQS